jgi:hypothetical protein
VRNSRAWQALAGSRRLAVRAGADLVFSLLLGTDLVLFLVWGANLLGLRESQVAFLRDALRRAGSVADLPWWAWLGLLGLLGLLAAANLAFALRPVRLKAAIRWSDQLRLNPSAEIGRRLLTGVHIGLLVIGLIGLSGPGKARPRLQRRPAPTRRLARVGGSGASGPSAISHETASYQLKINTNFVDTRTAGLSNHGGRSSRTT